MIPEKFVGFYRILQWEYNVPFLKDTGIIFESAVYHSLVCCSESVSISAGIDLRLGSLTFKEELYYASIFQKIATFFNEIVYSCGLFS